MFEQLGRGLVVEPFLANLLAGTALSHGNESQKAILESVIGGEKLLAFAHGEPSGRYTLAHVDTKAEKTSDGYVINGNKAVVISGDSADYLVVSAITEGNEANEETVSLFLVPAKTSGVHVRGYSTIDGYRAAEIALKDVAVGADALIGSPGQGLSIVHEVMAKGTLAVSAEALGAIEIAIDLTLEYLKTRKQFGVPIGKFQALQHRMADMMTEREQIRSALINAAGSLDTDQREWNISALKNLVGRSGRKIAEEAIQMHGGIAMTWHMPQAITQNE